MAMIAEAPQKNSRVIAFDERQKTALSMLVESLVTPLSRDQNGRIGRRIGSYFIENNPEFYAEEKSAGSDFYARGLSALISAFVKTTGKNINDQNSLKTFIREIMSREEGGYLRFFISIVARDVMVIYCSYPFAGDDDFV